MALTMTRTRTQTTLTKLATMVANVHGELEFVQGLLVQAEAAGAVEDAPASETESLADEGPAVAVPAPSLNFDEGGQPNQTDDASYKSPLSKKRKESDSAAPSAPAKVKKNRASAVLEEA